MIYTEHIVSSFSEAAATPAAAVEDVRVATQYETVPEWMGQTGQRSWDAAETNRLNQSHWEMARDEDINLWLRAQLPTLRARAIHEFRNNGILTGVGQSLVDDVVGPDGPMLEVQSDDKNYNAAAEEIWRQWFAAPTFRPNVSGASWLKLCVRNLPKCGEFLSVIATDPYAEGPVQLRLRPLHPRRLASPMHVGQSDRHIMGIEFDQFDRPARYWITESESLRTKHVPYSPDDIIHEFVIDEEGQARGYPWIAPSLPSIADLRDFDDQILDASRQMADQCQLLYTEHPDAPFYAMPESTTIERRTCKMAPPGWKPATYQAALPPVQYPDFRAEKHRDIGRPFNMPLMMVRLDASNHNYSSARIDTQSYNRTCEGIQCWLSGTPESCGMLNRLADLVFREARFSVAALKRRPAKVIYVWTWPQRPHVDPSKEADAETASLETGTLDFITALQNRGTTLDRHLKSLVRAVEAFKAAGLPLPAWAAGVAQAATPDARAARRTNEKLEAVNAS